MKENTTLACALHYNYMHALADCRNRYR